MVGQRQHEPVPAVRTPTVVQVAMQHAMLHPEEAFRNPERLAKAVEIQRDQHEMFVEHFGDDVVILPAAEAEARMQAFDRWARRKRVAALTDDGSMPIESDECGERDVPVFSLNADLTHLQTIGFVSDPIEGTMIYPELGAIEETFSDSSLVIDKKRRALIRELLVDTDFSPVILRRLAERRPDTADRVFGQVFRHKGFDWKRDGEELMRELQPVYYAFPRWPSVTVMGDDLLALASDPRPRKPARGRS